MKRLLLVSLLCIFAAAAEESRPFIVEGTAQRTNAQRSSPVAIGEIAPEFTLEDQKGGKVALSDSRGKSPVVLVFYRAYW